MKIIIFFINPFIIFELIINLQRNDLINSLFNFIKNNNLFDYLFKYFNTISILFGNYNILEKLITFGKPFWINNNYVNSEELFSLCNLLNINRYTVNYYNNLFTSILSHIYYISTTNYSFKRSILLLKDVGFTSLNLKSFST